MEVFNNLGFAAKCEIITRYATLVDVASHYHYTVKLFSWDRFFIEVYYDMEEEEITRIAIANERDLQKYLSAINLSDLGY